MESGNSEDQEGDCMVNSKSISPLKHGTVGVSGGNDSRIFNLGTWWRWMVSFTVRPPYPRYWVGSRAMDAVAKEQIRAPTENRTQVIQPIASDYIEWTIPAHG
jgi:hypothetical protein